MTFQIVEHADGTADVSGEVLGGGGCMGSFTGSGRVDDNRISVTTREASSCKIDIVRAGKWISATENNGCDFVHGARCNFTGAATRVR